MGGRLIAQLRAMAVRGLARMYRQDQRLFVFCLRRGDGGVVSEGLSQRYTAMTLIGLAQESEAVTRSVLGEHHPHDVCERLAQRLRDTNSLGDVAVILWAMRAVAYPHRREAAQRLLELRPVERAHPTVELSWALDAAVRDFESVGAGVADRLAERLLASFNPRSALFPHVLGEGSFALRPHVVCFADCVYPIHALANYSRVSGSQQALDAASRCAEQICRLQGAEGQWWWQYDRRTGDILERYPVYAVHQDAMAPMALIALKEAGGPAFDRAMKKGLDWLQHAPEINASLIDENADLIWRKVARREPGKLTRYIQGVTRRFSPSLSMPGLDRLFPPRAVDYEDRPYHLGWLLYAWPEERAKQWDGGASG
jgi:hypothetical protein